MRRIGARTPGATRELIPAALLRQFGERAVLTRQTQKTEFAGELVYH